MACWDWLPGGSWSWSPITTPITLSTAHAMRSLSACVRVGWITPLLEEEKAGHVAERLHGAAVAVDGARSTGDEALPVVHARLSSLEREGDHVHAARGGRGAQALEWHEDAEDGDREGGGRVRRVVEGAEVTLLRIALVVEVGHVESASDDSLRLRPVGVAQAGGCVLLVDLHCHRGVGRDFQDRRREVADPRRVGIVRAREGDGRVHRGDGLEVDEGVLRGRVPLGDRRRRCGQGLWSADDEAADEKSHQAGENADGQDQHDEACRSPSVVTPRNHLNATITNPESLVNA